MPKIVSNDVVTVLATIKNDATIEGVLKEQYFDSNGFVFNENYSDLANEAQKERLERKHKGIEIITYDFKNNLQSDQPVVETYTFKHNECIEIIGDKMFFSPMLFMALTQNPFKQEIREYPIDFAYANEDKYLINITIPDDYRVESLPKSVTIPMQDNLGSLNYLINETNKKIQLSVTLTINTAIIPADYYDILKAFFAEVVKNKQKK